MKNKNKQNNIKISIGIPAYNESANIKKLLHSLLSQIEAGYTLAEIIIISDGSTDSTTDIVRNMHSNKITLISHNTREGKSFSLNELLNLFTGDVLFLLDADIIISDSFLFTKIVKNNNFRKAGIISINAMPVEAENSFQKVVNAGFYAMKDIAMLWKNGRNYLLFKGCFLGLDKSFAKRVHIDKTIVNNDAYFYLLAKKMGLSPSYYDGAAVYYTSPRNLSDHSKQNGRFKTSQEEMENCFGKDLTSEYKIPASIYAKVIIKHLIVNPFYFTSYIMTKIFTKLANPQTHNHLWNIALSTKK